MTKGASHLMMVNQVVVHTANTSDKTSICETGKALADKGLKHQARLQAIRIWQRREPARCVDHDVEHVCRLPRQDPQAQGQAGCPWSKVPHRGQAQHTCRWRGNLGALTAMGWRRADLHHGHKGNTGPPGQARAREMPSCPFFWDATGSIFCVSTSGWHDAGFFIQFSKSSSFLICIKIFIFPESYKNILSRMQIYFCWKRLLT